MSPFFRGSVRPTKKHPKPWSLNPRLNPDLAKDGPRMSILGLPSTETDVTLPVFNSVYGRSSLKEPVTISLKGVHEDHARQTIPEEAADELPQQTTETPVAETAGVAEEEPSKVDAPAAETSQLVATSSTAAETAKSPSDPQPVQEESTKAIIPPEPAETAETEPLPEDRSLLAASSSPVVSEVVAAADNGAPEEPSQLPAEGEDQPDEASAGQESEGAEAKRELFAGALSAESLPAIDEEDPAAAAAAEAEEDEPVAVPEVTDLGVSTVSGLESIEEVPEAETPAAAEDPSGAVEAPVEETSDETPEASEQEIKHLPAEAVAEAETPEAEASPTEETSGVVEEPAVSQAPADDEVLEVASETAAPEATAPEPLVPEQEAAEAPVIPRHSVPTASVAAATATDEDVGGAAPVSTGGTRSSFTGSVSGSVATNEEPLVTDEQLEVSDEFRPGVKMYQMESSQRV